MIPNRSLIPAAPAFFSEQMSGFSTVSVVFLLPVQVPVPLEVKSEVLVPLEVKSEIKV